MRVAGAGEVRQVEGSIRTRALSRGELPAFGVALFALVVFLNGCTGFASGPSGNTRHTSSLQLTPGTVSFGRVGLGKQSTLTVSVMNPNQSPVAITKINVSNPQFTSLPVAAARLRRDRPPAFRFLKPSAMGKLTGTLSVGFDSATAPVVLDPSATGEFAQQISFNSPSVDFAGKRGHARDAESGDHECRRSGPHGLHARIDGLRILRYRDGHAEDNWFWSNGSTDLTFGRCSGRFCRRKCSDHQQ